MALISESALAGIHMSGDLTLGDLIVGLGTLALAGFTYLLARKTGQEVGWTRRSVVASEENVRLTRQSVEAQDRPFVVATPPQEALPGREKALGTELREQRPMRFQRHESAQLAPNWRGKQDTPPDTPQHWFFHVRLWNVGKGPAIVTDLSFKDSGREVLSANDRELLLHAPNGASARPACCHFCCHPAVFGGTPTPDYACQEPNRAGSSAVRAAGS
jgi:hypothetical protein